MNQPTESVRVEHSPKRVRALVDGVAVLDSRAAVLVWEHPRYPTYYLPLTDVSAELVDTGRVEPDPARGAGHVLDLAVTGRALEAAARAYPDSPLSALRDLVRIEWGAMDQWLEEDEPVYVHPRDPYKRVDILASSRRVRVELDGVTLADSARPRILFETSLIPRYYVPLPDVRTDLLRRSETTSHCPYKGVASWWSVQVGAALHEDLAWTYQAPLPESQQVAGLVCFQDERVDMVLDGEPQPRPATPFV
ncbi:MAG: DUF427 domain-containing protein [Actinomycetota bacterium]|nr:DUF427 domain-containing protein [Actinomycetota bacterium]